MVGRWTYSNAQPVGDLRVYNGIRAVVLGASGFIGRWVACTLQTHGAEVHAVVRDRSASDAVLSGYGIHHRVHKADLGDPQQLRDVLQRVRPSIVFNLAGYGVDRAEQNEELAYRINAALVEALCEAVADIRDDGWRGQDIVHVGSVAEYGEVDGNLSEDTEPLPHTLYGKSKLAGTRRVAELSQRHGLKGLTARLFAVYGPGEHPGRLLPSILESASTGTPIELTAGTQKKDFTYVEDAAEGLLRLGLSAAGPGEVVNLATGRLVSVRDFVNTAARVVGIPEGNLKFGALPSTGAVEIEHAMVPVERLRRLTGWAPDTSIEQGVSKTRRFLAEHHTALVRGGGNDRESDSPSTLTRSVPMMHSQRRAGDGPDVSFIMPCYNEEGVLGYTVPRLFHAFEQAGYHLELVAVDNGSSDRTGDVIRQMALENPSIIHHRVERNEGYGNGVLSGIPLCTAPWVGIIPSDGQVDAEDVVRLYEALMATDGMVLGKVRRRFRMDGLRRKFVSVLYNLFIRVLWPRLESLDMNGTPKLLPREVMIAMSLRSKGWLLDPEIMIKAHYMGVRVLELNAFARMRGAGVSHVRLGTCWEFFWNLLVFRFSRGWRRDFKQASQESRDLSLSKQGM